MLALGPLMIPYSLLALIAAVWLGEFAAKRALRQRGDAQGPPAGRLLFIGLLTARLAFVLEHADDYPQNTWAMLDIRDGGWNALAGFAGAWLAGIWLMLRNRSRAAALFGGLAAASITWGMAQGILSMHQDPPALPEVTLGTLAQQPETLQAFVGKPLVINLWASWCPPCRREMPAFQHWQTERPDIHFVFVNQGETPEVVEQFLAQQGLNLQHVLLDPHARIGQAIGQRALPATLFFDAQGKWVETRLGELSHATLRQKLLALTP